MRLLLYSSKGQGPAGRLQRHIEKSPRPCAPKTLHSIEELSGALRPFTGHKQETILVLFATDRRDLIELLSIIELLKNSRLILVLPDERPETVQTAHLLMPRYIGYADGDLSDVAAVLKKMLHRIDGEEYETWA
jgi:hypothetical protein